MAEYTPLTNFLIKDTLAPTDGNRLIKGGELQDEFNAIKASVDSKVDTGFTPTVTDPDVPVFKAKQLRLVGAARSVAVGATINDDDYSIPFTPTRESSQLLVKYNLETEFSLNSQNIASYTLRFQARIRNLENSTEFNFGRERVYLHQQNIRDVSDIGDSHFFAEEGNLLLHFVDTDSIETIAGSSSQGYEIRLRISQDSGGNRTQGFRDGVVTVQEIFV